jgi:hypothetical protein
MLTLFFSEVVSVRQPPPAPLDPVSAAFDAAYDKLTTELNAEASVDSARIIDHPYAALDGISFKMNISKRAS